MAARLGSFHSFWKTTVPVPTFRTGCSQPHCRHLSETHSSLLGFQSHREWKVCSYMLFFDLGFTTGTSIFNYTAPVAPALWENSQSLQESVNSSVCIALLQKNPIAVSYNLFCLWKISFLLNICKYFSEPILLCISKGLVPFSYD